MPARRAAGKHARSDAVIALQQRLKQRLGVAGAAPPRAARPTVRGGAEPAAAPGAAPGAAASEFEAQRAARGDAPVVDDSEEEAETGAAARAAAEADAAAAGGAPAVDAAMFGKAFKVRGGGAWSAWSACTDPATRPCPVRGVKAAHCMGAHQCSGERPKHSAQGRASSALSASSLTCSARAGRRAVPSCLESAPCTWHAACFCAPLGPGSRQRRLRAQSAAPAH